MGIVKNNIEKVHEFSQKLRSWKKLLLSYKYRHTYNELMSKAKFFYKDTKFKLQNLGATNYELGLFHYKNGNIYDARFRLWSYSKVWPGKPEVDYFLGRTNFELGKLSKAEEYLEKYMHSKNPTYRDECEYTLHAIRNEVDKIKEIPLSLVSHKFDIEAKRYEQFLLENTDIIPQTKMCAELSRYLSDIGRPYGNRLLDLGSGTGIIGSILCNSKAAGFVTGVDISSKACKIAAGKKADGHLVYNQVLNVSLDDFFQLPSKSGHNLIVLSDLLNCFANVEAVLGPITKVSSSDTVLAILLRTTLENEASKFVLSGEEFLHSTQTIKNALERLGWSLHKDEKVIYRENAWGHYFICDKSAK